MLKFKFYKIVILIVLVIIPIINITEVKADEYTENIIQLRAGGGSGSGGSSGGSSGSSSHGHASSNSGSSVSIIDRILSYIHFVIIAFFSSIVLYIKILRSSINSKRYLRMLSKKDITWKYRTIEKQVIETFYVLQNSWTNMKMEDAKEYMDNDLYESFKVKLEWMDVANKKNILKWIRLISLKPVSVHDDEDDDKDLVWFYIRGFMVDYTIDTITKEVIEGNNKFGMSFTEFWKFTRKGNKWLLTKILQANESDKIDFQ